MSERWLPVVGYEGYYEVSSQGRVRSVDRIITKLGQAPARLRGRLMKPTVDKLGRHWARFSRNDRKTARTVSRVVLEAFVGPCPKGMEGCHNDGDPGNNNVENLRWDTRSNNNYDAVRHGTHWAAKKTHCKHGHPFDELNTYVATTGHRACITCHNLRCKRAYLKKVALQQERRTA